MEKEIKRKKIIDLIKKEVSISKISKQLNVAKSTIFYHYKKIKGRKYQLTTIPKKDEVIGEFLGAFSGDGNFCFDKKKYHYRISIHLHTKDDYDYYLYLKNLFIKEFNKKPFITTKKNLLSIRFYSKKVYELINTHLILKNKTKNICLKRGINEYSNEFLGAFVRGLFDTDGCITKNKTSAKTISINLMTQIHIILKDRFSIENKLKKIIDPRPNCQDCFEITVPTKERLKFLKHIGLSNPRKRKQLKKALIRSILR